MGVTGFEAFQILLGFRVSFLSLWSVQRRGKGVQGLRMKGARLGTRYGFRSLQGRLDSL